MPTGTRDHDRPDRAITIAGSRIRAPGPKPVEMAGVLSPRNWKQGRICPSVRTVLRLAREHGRRAEPRPWDVLYESAIVQRLPRRLRPNSSLTLSLGTSLMLLSWTRGCSSGW